MDWNPVIGVATVAGVFIAGVVAYREWRKDKRNTAQQESEQKQRAELEREREQKQQDRERRQQDAEAPHLKPIGANWRGLTDMPLVRLAADVKQQDIDIRNIGKSTPLEVVGVLFGARVMNPQSRTRTDNLYGTYWAGKLSVAPAPELPARW
jgi:hypothetical protein